ncbi:MAG: secondary thiamine-phosphate synthase enzyme YjbQ [Candidatus Latescibacteria bacterium]|nr:secondary thiamine-phosphate synthase enzyme YjbQ [Candidatus Latescibacterota bacterium]
MIHTLTIATRSRNEFVDITSKIQDVVRESGLSEGLCTIFVPHTTAGLTINEGADPSVQRDILTHLQKIIPRDDDFRHLEGNSDAHIKASLMGSSQTVFVEEGQLVLGTWQAIYFAEFDGPRRRKVMVRVSGD